MSPRTPLQNEQIRAESKQKIMDAAFTLIAQNGYESTSIASIAQTAGVSKGLLYNYFTSKEELVKALVLGAVAEGDKLVAQLISDDPRETIENMFLWFFNEMRENHDHWRLMTELTFKIEKFDFVHDIATAKLKEFVGLLQGLLTEIGYDNALQEARIIAALFDGIGIQAIMAKEDYPLDEMQEYLVMKYCHEH
jgi:AcrR family transcriptional regulator